MAEGRTTVSRMISSGLTLFSKAAVTGTEKASADLSNDYENAQMSTIVMPNPDCGDTRAPSNPTKAQVARVCQC
jgi:hypothetical protein